MKARFGDGKSFTNPLGGNLIDVLPPAISLGKSDIYFRHIYFSAIRCVTAHPVIQDLFNLVVWLPRTSEETIQHDEKYFARKCWFSYTKSFFIQCSRGVRDCPGDTLEGSETFPPPNLIIRVWKIMMMKKFTFHANVDPRSENIFIIMCNTVCRRARRTSRGIGWIPAFTFDV